jgi:lipoprotein-releasing system permease protein
MLGGWYTVLHINDIHDWVGDTFGIRIFTKETHMFSTIPNEVDWNAAVVIMIGALVSGLLGALIPALRAARMQPMEALRYE